MRFRTWALAAALACGVTGVADAADWKPAVHHAKQQKAKKLAKVKRAKPVKVKPWKPKKVKRIHK